MSTVSDATSTIQDNLSQGIFDWDVTHSELIENNQVVADLTPQQRNELIAGLSDDDLKNWTQEIDGWSGALSASERQELFNNLAQGLDATQLTRLVKAFEGSPGGYQALGEAVANHASADTKLAFIQATQGSIDGEYYATQGRDGNAETAVVARVLGSLANDPAQFDAAVKSLSDSQLADVIKVGLGRNHIAGPYTSTTLYEPSAALDILRGAANSSDPEVKGRVFEAGTEHLTMVEGGSADAALTEGLTQIMQSDPNAVVNELQTRTDITGESLSNYIKEMLNSDRAQDVRNLLVQMQQGNDGSGNAYQNFANPETARNIGFFAGATAAAINSITGDAEDQANLLKNIFGAGFGAAGAANPAAGVIASVGNGITAIAIDDIINGVKNDNTDLKRALYELAIPRGPDGKLNMQGTGYTDFNAAYSAIAEVNR